MGNISPRGRRGGGSRRPLWTRGHVSGDITTHSGAPRGSGTPPAKRGEGHKAPCAMCNCPPLGDCASLRPPGGGPPACAKARATPPAKRGEIAPGEAGRLPGWHTMGGAVCPHFFWGAFRLGALAPNQSLESLPESGAKSIPCRGLLVESMKAPQKKWGLPQRGQEAGGKSPQGGDVPNSGSGFVCPRRGPKRPPAVPSPYGSVLCMDVPLKLQGISPRANAPPGRVGVSPPQAPSGQARGGGVVVGRGQNLGRLGGAAACRGPPKASFWGALSHACFGGPLHAEAPPHA
jgi:hypothetical protein